MDAGAQSKQPVPRVVDILPGAEPSTMLIVGERKGGLVAVRVAIRCLAASR